jgi:hypothetical protein
MGRVCALIERNSGNSIVPVPSRSTSAMIRRTSCETSTTPPKIPAAAASERDPANNQQARLLPHLFLHVKPQRANGHLQLVVVNRAALVRVEQVERLPAGAANGHRGGSEMSRRCSPRSRTLWRHAARAPDLLLLLLRHLDPRPSPRPDGRDLRHGGPEIEGRWCLAHLAPFQERADRCRKWRDSATAMDLLGFVDNFAF